MSKIDVSYVDGETALMFMGTVIALTHAIEVLNKIAAWDCGDSKTENFSSFDEPHAAKYARYVLSIIL